MSNTVVAMNAGAVDLKFVDISYPSLCIPRVFYETSEYMVYRVFDNLDFGKIKQIDMIICRNEKGEKYKRVFIHFDRWYWNNNAQMNREKLILGKEIKIVYSYPWYWKVSANKHVVRRTDVEEERRKEYMEEIARKEQERLREKERQIEQERRRANERHIEEERLVEKELQIAEERRREKERKKAYAQIRMVDDTDFPEMELFKIDYGNMQIPKNLKKKLVVRAV